MFTDNIQNKILIEITKFSVNPSKTYIEDGRSWYDTKIGIQDSIKTLSGFLKLTGERHIAGYIRKEELNQIYVFGDYYFDTCGNCAIAKPSIKNLYPNIPDVLDHAEYWQFVKARVDEESFYGISFMFYNNIPSENVICPVCNAGWDIGNMRDVVSTENGVVVDATDFIGKTLFDFKEYYSSLSDAEYYIRGEPFLNNKRFIDLSPWTDNPKTELEKTTVKNDNGWVGTKDGINDSYVIEAGDRISLGKVMYFHTDCKKKYLDIVMSQSFKDIFLNAGYKKLDIAPTKNEYCGCEYCAPWYFVKTEIGVFKIGWRKRVINIEFRPKNPKKNKINISQLFENEDVTKGNDSIHAWGYEKAMEYLKKILEYCKK